MKDVEIKAASFAVPENVVSNQQLTELMDTSDEWIVKRTGIKRRHVSQGENTSDLAYQAAKKALVKTDYSAQDIQLIVVATMTPDSLTPSTAAIVQAKLGAENAVCFDISAACSGFSYALSVARSLMLVNDFQTAIVIGAEVLSKLVDWHDRSTAVLFGDGAGAVLLSTSSEKHFLGQNLATYGELGEQLTAGQFKAERDFLKNTRQLTAFKMNGREVYRFATHEVPDSLKKAADNAQFDLTQIDHFLLHQANYRIIEQVARKLKLPMEKFSMNIAEYGNTAAASEAILLAELIEKRKIKPGEIVALSGFGGGLTIATIIFKL